MKMFFAAAICTALSLLIACQAARSDGASLSPIVSADSRDRIDPGAEKTESDNEAPRVELADAKAAYDAGSAIFIDTRSRPFFVNERIKGAISIPVAEMAGRHKEVPKGKKVITYCA